MLLYPKANFGILTELAFECSSDKIPHCMSFFKKEKKNLPQKLCLTGAILFSRINRILPDLTFGFMKILIAWVSLIGFTRPALLSGIVFEAAEVNSCRVVTFLVFALMVSCVLSDKVYGFYPKY